MTLIIGIPACTKMLRDELVFATPARFVDPVLDVLDGAPLLIPPQGERALALLDRIDGLLLSGSASNVHPALYGTDPSLTPDRHDPGRDATTLPLIRAALARGLPVLAICRGVQELNVALGGTLHQQVHGLDGREDHRAGDGTIDHKFRFKHPVQVTGALAEIVGAASVQVNSLHEQAIDRVAPGLVVEAEAEDGTVEAVRMAGARGFAMGVQFHPEWHYRTDAPSRAIFQAFAAACRTYRDRPLPPG